MVTIGNFDGCHLGHQKLIKHVVEEAKKRSQQSVVVSFSPHPREFFSGQSIHKLFTNLQKSRAFKELGVDVSIEIKFDQNFSNVTHETFFNEFLLNTLKASSIWTGANFYFGAKRLGTPQWLKDQCLKSGVTYKVFESICDHNKMISSSMIRNLIEKEGDVLEASKLLGRPYLLEGSVVQGFQRGRTIGFPTANLKLSACSLLPKYGVYAGYAVVSDDPSCLTVDEYLFKSAINIGVRPTVNSSDLIPTVEAHLVMDGSLDLYGKTVGLYLVKKLRDEMKFGSLDELKTQIARDLQDEFFF